MSTLSDADRDNAVTVLANAIHSNLSIGDTIYALTKTVNKQGPNVDSIKTDLKMITKKERDEIRLYLDTLDPAKTAPPQNAKSDHMPTNANGQLHGICIKLYENGRTNWTCDYKNGKKHGTETTYYFRDGDVYSTCTWKNGARDGKLINYLRDGKKVSEIIWKNDQVESSTYWSPNGSISCINNYIDGNTSRYIVTSYKKDSNEIKYVEYFEDYVSIQKMMC